MHLADRFDSEGGEPIAEGSDPVRVGPAELGQGSRPTPEGFGHVGVAHCSSGRRAEQLGLGHAGPPLGDGPRRGDELGAPPDRAVEVVDERWESARGVDRRVARPGHGEHPPRVRRAQDRDIESVSREGRSHRFDAQLLAADRIELRDGDHHVRSPVAGPADQAQLGSRDRSIRRHCDDQRVHQGGERRCSGRPPRRQRLRRHVDEREARGEDRVRGTDLDPEQVESVPAVAE